MSSVLRRVVLRIVIDEAHVRQLREYDVVQTYLDLRLVYILLLTDETTKFADRCDLGRATVK